MGRLFVINLKRIFGNRMNMFWSIIFPLVLGTLFYVTFGSGVDLEKMKAIPVAAVEKGNETFGAFLEEMDGSTLKLSWMTEEEASKALKEGSVIGIYYADSEPSLAVTGSQLQESILETLLTSYLENEAMMKEIGEKSLLGMAKAVQSLSDYPQMVEEVTVSGKSMDNNINYFYALLGMACLFGAFQGLTGAEELKANLSPLAARRSISPVHRMTMVVAEMLAGFAAQFFNICVLLAYLTQVLHLNFGNNLPAMFPICILGSMAGVAFGIFIGSSRMPEGPKIGILVGSTLLMSFLAGLMFGGMKDVVEKYCPVLNRINPAALISDAFYSIAVYENPDRYRMNLFLLALITGIMVLVSFCTLRRERYDSI